MNRTRTSSVDEAAHRRLGVDLYNRTWRLLEISTRTAADQDEMIRAAHASRLHWQECGGSPANLARGEWLCARVYAVLGRGEPALWHARRSLALLEAGGEGFEDWDPASAYQGMAHACLAAGERDEARAWATRCRESLAAVEDREDREVVEQQLAELDLA